MAELGAIVILGAFFFGFTYLLKKASNATGYQPAAARQLAAEHGLVPTLDEHEFEALRAFSDVRDDERPPVEVDYRFTDSGTGGSVFRQWSHYTSFDDAGDFNVVSTHATRSHFSAAHVVLTTPAGSASLASAGSRRIEGGAPIGFTGEGARAVFRPASDRIIAAEGLGYLDLIAIVERDQMYVRVRLLPIERCPEFLAWVQAFADEIAGARRTD